MRKRLKLGKIPFLCWLLCALSSAAQSWLVTYKNYQSIKVLWHFSANTWVAGLSIGQEGAEIGAKDVNRFSKFSFRAAFADAGPGLLQDCEGPRLWAWGTALAAPGWVQPAQASTPISPHLQGTHCTQGELGLRGQLGDCPAPYPGQGSPHSSLSVNNWFLHCCSASKRLI